MGAVAPILSHFFAASATQSAITLKQRPDEGDTKSTPATLSRMAHTLGINAPCNLQPKSLYTGSTVREILVQKSCLFLPLTCNRGTKTRGCSTYPDSFSCCISNTVRISLNNRPIVRFDMLKRHLRDATCLIHERSPALNELHIGARSTLPLQHAEQSQVL